MRVFSTHGTAEAGSAEAISALLDEGAAADAIDQQGQTPEDYVAARMGQLLREITPAGYANNEGQGSAATRFEIADNGRRCLSGAQRYSECAIRFERHGRLVRARQLRARQLLAWARLCSRYEFSSQCGTVTHPITN